MACTNSTITNLAQQTPFYDRMFLTDWKPMDSPLMGRHESGVWEVGTSDIHYIDRIQIGQPNLNTQWGQISVEGCSNACTAPRQYVNFGSTRSSYYMQQIDLSSQLWCLKDLQYGTRTPEQIEKVYAGLKKIPDMFTTDFMRVHAVDLNSVGVQIASKNLLDLGTNVFVPDINPDDGSASNIGGQLTTVNLGSAGLLPTSGLTFTLLDYFATTLGLEGYAQAGSGLSEGVYNLITDQRTWAFLTNGNPSMSSMMALTDPQQASALYKIGQGIQKPFGNYAPTLDNQPIRFETAGGGILNRVFPYYNVPTDSGAMRVVNPAYVRARYQISFLWHPKAIKIWSPSFAKIHEKVPSMNSGLYGKWDFKNGDVLMYRQPDGTECSINNDKNEQFYWLCALQLGFQYKEPQLIIPILHLVDGSGRDSIVDSAVCGSAPSYTAQIYSSDPIVC